jgi:hypothetical protein
MAHFYRIDTIIPATNPAVDLNYVKQFARVSNTVDDAIIASFIMLATEQAEKYLNRAIGTQTIQMSIAHTPVPQTQSSVGNGWFGTGWSAYGYGYGFSNQHAISLFYSPVQQIVSVSRGYWDQYPDTVLTYGVDYVCDLASTPARIKFLIPGTTTSTTYGIDHTSIQYVAGYGFTNLIQITGTASAAETLGLTVGGQTVAVTVNVGDTAQTVIANTQAAIIAIPGTPSAAVLSASMIQLRADNVTVNVGNVPTGLTVTASNPASAVPAGITNAITYLAAYLYQNMADDMAEPPNWFYTMLAPFRVWSFS